jgi:hypothetical protein
MSAKTKRLLQDVGTTIELGKRLAKHSMVIKNSKLSSEEEGQSLAMDFSDIEESLCRYIEEYLPQLITEQDENKINDLLIDIGDEFRHILYHFKGSQFLRDHLDLPPNEDPRP